MIVIDNISEFVWTFPLKNKNAQTKKDCFFENILISSKRKPNFIETDRGKEFYKKVFQNFLNNNNFEHYSRYTSPGAVFPERFNRTIRDLKRPVIEKGENSWVDILPVITKQYNTRIHFSTKLRPIQASLKKNEGYVYRNLLDKRKEIKTKLEIGD